MEKKLYLWAVTYRERVLRVFTPERQDERWWPETTEQHVGPEDGRAVVDRVVRRSLGRQWTDEEDASECLVNSVRLLKLERITHVDVACDLS